ncbi:hypothetical protein AS156_18280 [Bradyrhizobium macuxiense]|uniref:Uncharacterized protein n=1 Tax=Bradyrhizobium macuxiense TaxID=1755647 RepID=A0A109JGA2_9BRAD|nr:hypothetical protein [Bradyrhizobium macuxiense]KWV48428.1 hypothetical protein AS156_18280 [Bradyrhizobium macuxiense]
MNFQVTVLKVLVSYPDGFASMAALRHDIAILATSGRDWADRTKRLASRVPGLDIFSQRLVERENGGWKITSKGRNVLDFMEARSGLGRVVALAPTEAPVPRLKKREDRSRRRRERRDRRRKVRELIEATAS